MIGGCRICGQWLSTRRLAVHEPACTGGKGRSNLSANPQGRPKKILVDDAGKGVIPHAR